MNGEDRTRLKLQAVSGLVGDWRFTETKVPLSLTEYTQVCQNDPRRWAVGFADDGGQALLTTIAGSTIGDGFLLTQPGIEWLKWSDVGVMCQTAWYAMTKAGIYITVYEVIIIG